MAGHSRALAGPWKVLAGVALIGGHAIFLHRLRHAGVSLTVMAGLVLLLIAKHVGMLGSFYGLFRRRPRD